MADYTGLTNKLGNAIGIPFSSFSTEEQGIIDLAFAADDLTRQNDMFWLDGIRQDSANWADGDGAVRWSNGFNVYVRPFRGAVNGTIVYAPQIALTFDQESISERVDSVIIRRDYAARTVNVMILKGTSGSTEPPVLTRNAYAVYDYELARVHVVNTIGALAQTDITDMRTVLVADFGIRPTSADAGKSISIGQVGQLIIDGPKLDTRAYAEDAQSRDIVQGRIAANGTILSSRNIAGGGRTAAGLYTFAIAPGIITDESKCTLSYSIITTIASIMMITAFSKTSISFRTAQWDSTTADREFSFAIKQGV
ncbi:hypothetical protein KL86DPRO_10299 [uncultured delta proteobacterium]|uniref:Uncharacterized protein n=1 Tax=uncultured delta proteobacterium TaxID=34034 RepID=A0A212IXY8_9DELT|nr:hypothetical protein KL86DPRO_10299 [uncultured delta proteobacterium]